MKVKINIFFIVVPLLLIVLTLSIYCASVFAEDEVEISKSDLAVIPFKKVTVKGLVFRVPGDIPFVEKDGILKPISFDEYFYSKIVALEKTVTDLKARLDATEAQLAKLQKGDEPQAVLTETVSVPPPA